MNIFIAIILDAYAGQSAAFDLPVIQGDIEDFVAVWSDFDPNATGFIETTKLEKLLEELASDSKTLFYKESLRKRVGNLNVNEEMDDNEMKKILKRNKTTRQNYLIALEIPTYGEFKYVNFYDVLQMMT